jgi:polyisoprenyl-teichoic acid--peptidoglycan teichoic acid transferase
VRFRHFDNDLVRSARQQDFLREARQKLPPETLIRDRTELLKIFTDYTTSDIGEAVPLLELLKTFASVQSAPVREVHFPAQLGETYVTANDAAIKTAVAQFLDTEGTPGSRPAGESPPAEQPSGGDQNQSGENKPDQNKPGENKPDEPKPADHFVGPTMDDATEQSQASATQLSHVKKHDGDLMVDFPIFYPTRLVPGSIIIRDSRAFPIDGPGDDVFHGYKQVVQVPGSAFGNGLIDEYYGVSGTDWTDVPILQNPSETRTIDGKQYLLFYDGDRLRMVGWKTSHGAYWVNNTLLQSLDEGEMLSIATSMRELDQK